MKWYNNKSTDDLLVIFSRIGHEAVAYAIQGDFKKSEILLDEFLEKFDEVIPRIVDTKAEFYNYNQEIYNSWEKCHRDLWSIKRSMMNQLEIAFNK